MKQTTLGFIHKKNPVKQPKVTKVEDFILTIPQPSTSIHTQLTEEDENLNPLPIGFKCIHDIDCKKYARHYPCMNYGFLTEPKIDTQIWANIKEEWDLIFQMAEAISEFDTNKMEQFRNYAEENLTFNDLKYNFEYFYNKYCNEGDGFRHLTALKPVLIDMPVRYDLKLKISADIIKKTFADNDCPDAFKEYVNTCFPMVLCNSDNLKNIFELYQLNQFVEQHEGDERNVFVYILEFMTYKMNYLNLGPELVLQCQPFQMAKFCWTQFKEKMLKYFNDEICSAENMDYGLMFRDFQKDVLPIYENRKLKIAKKMKASSKMNG